MTTIQTNVATVAASNAAQAKSAITSDFNTFLTLLTTQMKNQDPLNPMESSEFATQLATFSGVEQQVRTNENLAALLAQNGLSLLSQLTQWVGLEVRNTAPVSFAGQPIEVYGSTQAGADAARLNVRDVAGNLVQSLPVPLPVSQMTWAGVDKNGRPMPAGQYRLEVESLREGVTIGSSPVEHYVGVTEARSNGLGGVTLVLKNGSTVDATTVSALRKPAV